MSAPACGIDEFSRILLLFAFNEVVRCLRCTRASEGNEGYGKCVFCREGQRVCVYVISQVSSIFFSFILLKFFFDHVKKD